MAEVSKAMREKMEKRNKDLSTRGGGKMPFFIFKEGETRLRTLPVAKDEEFAIEAPYVFISKEAGGFISPTWLGKKCAWTEKFEKLDASKDANDKELAKKMRPKKKFFSPHIKYNDLKGKEVDAQSGAKLALLINKQYQAMIDLFLDDDYGDMTDPLTGYDIKFKRTGTTQFDTEYSLRACPPSKLPKEFRKIYDIKEMMMPFVPSYEETVERVKAFLNESVEDEAPKKKKVKLGPNGKPLKKKKTDI